MRRFTWSPVCGTNLTLISSIWSELAAAQQLGTAPGRRDAPRTLVKPEGLQPAWLRVCTMLTAAARLPTPSFR